MMLNYEKVLRNLKLDHDEIKQKKAHKKCVSGEKPCQVAWLITFLEAHPPLDTPSSGQIGVLANGEFKGELSQLVRNS